MPILRDCVIYYGGVDLTATANEFSVDASAVDLDVTTFGSAGNHERIAGIEDATASVMTFGDPAIVEPALSTKPGTVELLTAVQFPTGGTATAGDRVYALRGLLSSTKQPLKVGDVSKLDATLSGAQAEGVLQGTLMAPKQTVATSSFTGAFFNLGAVAAGQSLYFGVHVFSVTGDRSPTFNLQRNPTSPATAGASVTVLSLSRSTPGSSFISSTTTTTDAYWRIAVNLGGTTGSVTFAAFAAIQ